MMNDTTTDLVNEVIRDECTNFCIRHNIPHIYRNAIIDTKPDDIIYNINDIIEKSLSKTIEDYMDIISKFSKFKILIGYMINNPCPIPLDVITSDDLDNSLYFKLLPRLNKKEYVKIISTVVYNLIRQPQLSEDGISKLTHILYTVTNNISVLDMVLSEKPDYGNIRNTIYLFFGRTRVDKDKFHVFEFMIKCILLNKKEFVSNYKKHGMNLSQIKKLCKNDHCHFGFTTRDSYIANIDIINTYNRGDEVITMDCGSELNKKCIILDNWTILPEMMGVSADIKSRTNQFVPCSDLLGVVYLHNKDKEYKELVTKKNKLFYKK